MNYNKNVWRGILLISQLGISMMSPILLSGVIGYVLDEKFKADFFFLIFIILGIMAGFRNVYLLTKEFYEPAHPKVEKDKKRKPKIKDKDSKKM